jgi:hypothetical protein
MHAGSAGTQSEANSPAAASFRKKRGLTRGIFRHFLWAPEPVEATGVCYRGAVPEDKMPVSNRFPQSAIVETFQ